MMGLLILIASKAMPAACLPEAAASAALYPDAASHQPADAAD
ncbi:hypothetical protein [Massilia sp. CF038]|nr:hypothetical protein [Massilia sp. CF038]